MCSNSPSLTILYYLELSKSPINCFGLVSFLEYWGFMEGTIEYWTMQKMFHRHWFSSWWKFNFLNNDQPHGPGFIVAAKQRAQGGLYLRPFPNYPKEEKSGKGEELSKLNLRHNLEKGETIFLLGTSSFLGTIIRDIPQIKLSTLFYQPFNRDPAFIKNNFIIFSNKFSPFI